MVQEITALQIARMVWISIGSVPMLIKSGKPVRIARCEFFEQKRQVFNLHIAGNTNYLVSKNGVLVHNACSPKIDDLEIIVDENLSPDLVSLLRNRGGLKAKRFPLGTLDPDIIAYAQKNRSVILTNNTRDFINQNVAIISVPEKFKPRTALFDLVSEVINAGGQTVKPTTIIRIGQ